MHTTERTVRSLVENFLFSAEMQTEYCIMARPFPKLAFLCYIPDQTRLEASGKVEGNLRADPDLVEKNFFQGHID
jgi:hypothetical protein